MHPQRPFFLVSSSRDTTLRFWIFEDHVRPLLVSSAFSPDRMAELLGAPEEAMNCMLAAPGSFIPPPTKLYGQASRELVAFLHRSGLTLKPPSLAVYEKILTFFLYRPGIEDLWGLLAAIRGEASPGTSSNRVVFHEQELIACQKSKALELASLRGQIGLGGKHEDRLLKAAQIMLRIGDLRSYCKFTAQAGHWERAICVAPGVSRQYWQELCAEYIESLSAQADLQEVAPFLVISGQQSRLTDALIERGELDNAFVVAKADTDGLLPKREPLQPLGAAQEPPAGTDRGRLEEVAAKLARKHASMGEPLQAAMCYLAISAGTRAVHSLSSAHEVVLAYVVADALGLPHEPIVLKLLANCAEKDQRWDLAADVWRRHPKGLDMHIPLLASRAPDKAAAQAWSPWTPQQHQDALQECQTTGNRAGVVLHEVCLGHRAQAAQDGIEALHALFSTPGGWEAAQARQILDALEALPLQDMTVKDIAGVLSCAAYVGLVEAQALGYHELMFPLGQTLKNIITHQNLQFPVSIHEISLMEATTVSHWNPQHATTLLSSILSDPSAPSHIRQASEHHLEALKHRVPGDDWHSQDFDTPGFSKMAGGHLPSCYKRFAKTSVLTNQLIKGPAFELEDKKSHISVTDAVAWTRVNAFSPLNTGCKIYAI
jgi:hypothetical protein